VKRETKPIRVFYSTLSQRFYATKAWRECPPPNGARYIEVTGEQFDVTDDIAGLIEQHNIAFKRRLRDRSSAITPPSSVGRA